MEWLDPGGSHSGASVQDRFAVGVAEQNHWAISGATASIITAPPTPGPARTVDASQMLTGASGNAPELLVTVMTQWMGPPNGAGVHTLLIQMPDAGGETGGGLSGGAGAAAA